METNTLTENGVSTTKGLGEEMYINLNSATLL